MVPSSFGCGSAVLAAIAMFAPSAAAFSAMARPMPREAPVMNSVLPCKDMGSLRQRSGKDAVRAFDDDGLQPACLRRDILREETGERDASPAIAIARGRKRLLGKETAAGRRSEQFEIWRCACEHRV